MRLREKVAIITGAASGIGRASALRFSREGARVFVTDRDEQELHATLHALRDAGASAAGEVHDLSLRESALAIASGAHRAFGRVDVLLHCAALSAFGTVEDDAGDGADLDRVWEVNVRGTWLLTRAVIPHLRRAGAGGIIILSSITGIIGAPGMAAYATTKGALLALTRTLALELAEARIRVNAICPASIDTPMLQRAFARQDDAAAARARNVKRHPLGRLGTPDDIANLALFLASDEAAFITGGTHVVDGGALLARRWAE